jgi:rubredoxin
MAFVYWEKETDFKNLSTIRGCQYITLPGIGNIRPDFFLDSRPGLGSIATQYIGNQQMYHQGEVKLVKQWRKNDMVDTYFVVSMQEHAGADGIHWPLFLNTPGEGGGPDTLRMFYNHELIDDSDDHAFLIDEAYMAAGGECKDLDPPTPPPAGSWQCRVCSHVYDAEKDGAGAAFEDLPEDWSCPQCGSPKSAYHKNDGALTQTGFGLKSGMDKDENSWREIEYTFSPTWVPPAPTPPPSPSGPFHWQCGRCEHVYDVVQDGNGTAFEDLPDSWRCPVCAAPKSAFVKVSQDGVDTWVHEHVV